MWPLSSEECYVSIDIEADGPVPGLHSMLAIGAAAFTSEGVLGEIFAANLEPLPEASEDPRTMRWWASQPAAWKACRIDPEAPETAMLRFHAWILRQRDTVGLPVMVAVPAAYDAMWIQWYLHRFVGEDPFRRRAVDVRTLAMAAMGTGYQATKKSSLPPHWRSRAKHSHVAIDDAIEQGELFVNVVHQLNVQRGDVALASQIRQTAKTYRRQQRQERLRRRLGRQDGPDGT